MVGTVLFGLADNIESLPDDIAIISGAEKVLLSSHLATTLLLVSMLSPASLLNIFAPATLPIPVKDSAQTIELVSALSFELTIKSGVF